MTTTVIIDDEPKSILALKSFIQQHCPEIKILATADNATKGQEIIEQFHPQLVFLDIEMPVKSGFDLLLSLPVIDFEIIFITAYNQYALKAFRFSAIDYLLKPFRISELMEAIDKATIRIKEKTAKRNYDLLLKNLTENDAHKQKLIFTDRGEQFLVATDEIKYLIADGNYTMVYTTKKQFLCAKNLKEYEDILPADLFFRIHHGHMVNLKFIDKIQKGRGGTVIMQDGKTLEIAVRRKEEFLSKYDSM